MKVLNPVAYYGTMSGNTLFTGGILLVSILGSCDRSVHVTPQV